MAHILILQHLVHPFTAQESHIIKKQAHDCIKLLNEKSCLNKKDFNYSSIQVSTNQSVTTN